MPDPIIKVSQLTREFRVFERKEGVLGGLVNLFVRDYKNIRAVNEISFEVQEGEIVGYIGPNGAGKSTTVKMLSGILVPTSGDIMVNGQVPYRDRYTYTKSIGAVFGQRTQLWWDIAVVESFKLLKKIYDVTDSDYAERLRYLSELLNLNEYLHIPVRKLSLGQRMRCDLAASLLHNPKLLFLDEPTIGLDVVAKDDVRKILREVNREFNTTIILTTHDLADIEELCERILIIDHGKLIYKGTLEALREKHILEAYLTVDIKEDASLETLRTWTGNQDIDWEQMGERRFRARFKKKSVSGAELIRKLMEHSTLGDVSLVDGGIEDVVKKIYREKSA